MTLEPRLLYLNVPYRDQDDLPLFDTAPARSESGAAVPHEPLRRRRSRERCEPGERGRHDAACSSAEDGTQFLAATLGQIHYFEAPRVLLPDETRRSGNTSDFVAQLALTGFKDWNADIGMQWNPEDGRKERAQARLQYMPGPEQVVNVGYRFQRDLLEQAEVSAAWPIDQALERLRPLRLFLRGRQGPRAIRRPRIQLLLLAAAGAGPPVRQQPHGRAGHGHLPAAGTHGACQCRIGGGCFPLQRNSRLLPQRSAALNKALIYKGN